MIAECPRCGGVIPADTPTRYETGKREWSRCRFVVTTATGSASIEDDEPSSKGAVADGGRELELEDSEVSH